MRLSRLWGLSCCVDCVVVYVALCYDGLHPSGQQAGYSWRAWHSQCQLSQDLEGPSSVKRTLVAAEGDRRNCFSLALWLHWRRCLELILFYLRCPPWVSGPTTGSAGPEFILSGADDTGWEYFESNNSKSYSSLTSIRCQAFYYKCYLIKLPTIPHAYVPTTMMTMFIWKIRKSSYQKLSNFYL